MPECAQITYSGRSNRGEVGGRMGTVRSFATAPGRTSKATRKTGRTDHAYYRFASHREKNEESSITAVACWCHSDRVHRVQCCVCGDSVGNFYCEHLDRDGRPELHWTVCGRARGCVREIALDIRA